MGGLENSLFQLKFTTKQLQKQSRKAAKDEAAEKVKLKKGNTEGARIYASNAIRKKTESLNLLRLSSRVDAVSSRVETAVAMRSVTSNMTSVVKNMDRAMASMNLEQISMVMEKFEGQFEDLDVQTGYMENAMGDTAAMSTPQDQVDSLMQQVAEEAGLEVSHELNKPELGAVPELEKKAAVEEDQLAQRLRALRPAT